ncbi:MAG: hypothetical protein U9R60_18375, partial [Bacteroidota bacterium]|nr:hypothetical protein [Bacteroidota bacterium]
MKNTTYLTSVLLLALMLVLSSCKEKSDDDDNGGGNIPSNYRLVEWITYDDYQEEEKAIVTYNNNLIQTILGYDYQERGEWVENFKYEMSYPENNKAVVDLYSKENDLWVVYFTDVINYENGFVVECITYYNDNGNWIPAYRKTFSYN